MFAQSTGEATAPGEPDDETRNALAAARSTEQEIGALRRGLALAGEALAGGEKAAQKLAAARAALGQRGDSGALRWLLDHAAAEQARQEAAASQRLGLRTLIGTIKGVGTLPISFAERAELGRTLLQAGVERGLVAPALHKDFEAAVLSQFGLAQAQSAITKATEPGEALAILAHAKAEGLLQPMDSDLLDRQAKERDAVAVARHRTRLTIKEQDDLAAFERGELPEPLSEESFTLLHGEKAAAAAYARYRAARTEGEAIAAIRGKDAQGIEAAWNEWQGDPAVFDAAVAKDAQARLRDPVGYALSVVPGARDAWKELPEAERSTLLWSAQAATGIPANQRSLWSLAKEEAMAAEWDALPPGFAGRNEKLGYLQKYVLTLPPTLQQAAIARLVRQGIVDGTEDELTQVLRLLREGRANPARRAAVALGARTAGATAPHSALNPDDGRRSTRRTAPIIPAQALVLPNPPVPPLPGQPTFQDGIDAIGRLLSPAPPAFSVPQEVVDPPEKEPEASPAKDILSTPGARSAVDVFARNGLTTTEAEAVVVDVLQTQGAESETFDLAGFAQNYATLLPIGSSDPTAREEAASAVAADFRSIQAVDGRMTQAELSLLAASPAYAIHSGRGVAWIDNDNVVIGDAIVTADGEQLVVETADGLLFAWREGSGPTARYVVDDVLTPGDLIAPQSRESEAGWNSAGTAAATAGGPGEDPDQEPPRDTVVYRVLDPKTGEVRYVGITQWYKVRSIYWLRMRGYATREVENLGSLRRAEARGVEQALIESHKLRGQLGTLDNLINSIATRNPQYAALVARGRELLVEARYPGIH
jgi:hypothetical protein